MNLKRIKKLTDNIRLSVTPEEKQEFAEIADRYGTSLSQFARNAVREAARVAKIAAKSGT